MRDDERASVIQGVVEDKIQVPGFLFGSSEKLVVEATEEELENSFLFKWKLMEQSTRLRCRILKTRLTMFIKAALRN